MSNLGRVSLLFFHRGYGKIGERERNTLRGKPRKPEMIFNNTRKSILENYCFKEVKTA
jgi:hypothetical protein